MEIIVKEDRIVLEGDFDIFHARDAKSEIEESYEENPRDMVLDFSGVGFMDSTGLGILVALLEEFHEEGHSLKVINVDPKIQKVFRITELDKIFLEDDDE